MTFIDLRFGLLAKGRRNHVGTWAPSALQTPNPRLLERRILAIIWTHSAYLPIRLPTTKGSFYIITSETDGQSGRQYLAEFYH